MHWNLFAPGPAGPHNHKDKTDKTGKTGQITHMTQDVPAMKAALVRYMLHVVGKAPEQADGKDWFMALAFLLRGLLSERRIETETEVTKSKQRRVYYLSMEYLLGRSMMKNLLDLNLADTAREALAAFGQDVDTLAELEHDPALGNGGLGRLAACFLDSMVTQGYAGYGYGLRYEFGLFAQSIEDGQQVEHPDNWLHDGDPWEFERRDIGFTVRFFGSVERPDGFDQPGRGVWSGGEEVTARAHDFPVAGFRNGRVTNLRLWSAQASDAFDLKEFNDGNYIKAVEDKVSTEVLSKILYPDDSTLRGQELRLKQEYFFVSASLQDIFAKYQSQNGTLAGFETQNIIQLNDTHPALGIAEMMRLLVDEHDFSWRDAWEMTRQSFAYTNHTLLPEALERWPIAMLDHVLPRHLQIIFDINAQFLADIRVRAPGDIGKLARMSLVDDDARAIRMAHLAIVGSAKVNGVAALHTQLLRQNVFPDFDQMSSGKFVNVTNGVTPRRWVLQANPALAALITEKVGPSWPTDLPQLQGLLPFAQDPAFCQQFQHIKQANKQRLADLIQDRLGLAVDPSFLFDTQIKRLHEYKRQLLNVLHIIHRYNRLRAGVLPAVPRVMIFAGKAAPGYYMAKLIIRLIHDVAKVINADPQADGHLKVVFLPNYSGSLAEVIIPGTDLSEQISTAGTEASGTGNMKFALNGALTIGTYDGANVEICEAVGADNIFIFGLKAHEVAARRAEGYQPRRIYQDHADLAEVLDMIGTGAFSPGAPARYADLVNALLDGGDHYMLLADFQPYISRQVDVDSLYLDQESWQQKAVLNCANMGPFSADRSIREYAEKIWQVNPF